MHIRTLCLYQSRTSVPLKAASLVCLIAYVIAITHASCKDTAVSLQALMRTSHPYALCRVSSRYDAPPPVYKCTIAVQIIVTVPYILGTPSQSMVMSWTCEVLHFVGFAPFLHSNIEKIFLHVFVCCLLTVYVISNVFCSGFLKKSFVFYLVQFFSILK